MHTMGLLHHYCCQSNTPVLAAALFLCPHCRANHLRFQLNLYQLRENRQITPSTFMHMISHFLYSRR